jgi:L,D-transpeptidase YcbB
MQSDFSGTKPGATARRHLSRAGSMNKTTSAYRLRLLAAVFSAAAFMPAAAHATTFLDILFGNRPRPADMGRSYNDPGSYGNGAARPIDPSTVKRVRVTEPIFYTYKPDPLVPIDFTKLDPQITSSAATNAQPADLSLQSNIFADALDAFKATHVRATKEIADAIVEYYSTHHAFMWVSGYNANAKAAKLAAFFAKAGEDGLDPADYAVGLPQDGFDLGNIPERLKVLANFEVEMSARALRYASDATSGRIIPDRLSGYHDLPEHKVDYRAVLDKLAQTDDPAAYLESMQPQNKWYVALKKELAALDAKPEPQEKPITVAPGTLIHPGDTSPELPNVLELIRRRASADFLATHGAVLAANASQTVYGSDIVALVKDYQKEAGRQPDGVIGSNTIASLVGNPPQDKRERVVDAMEGLRWLPHDLGDRFVMVNAASFHAGYYVDGNEALGMKAVVGQPSKQTYFFANEIQEVVFNPSWGVPRSIIFNEMMPKILANPGYLEQSGYEVTDDRGNRISPYDVNWVQIAQTGGNVNIKQLPGPDNALGRLKILFPNSHDIYMHDTPEKAFFARSVRALSHGCIRLQHPQEMAAAVMGTTVDQLKPYFAQDENTIRVPKKIPIYVAYFTAWPDAQTGKVDYYDDVYQRDSSLQKAIEATRAVRAETS